VVLIQEASRLSIDFADEPIASRPAVEIKILEGPSNIRESDFLDRYLYWAESAV
jgi:hypothetical protein